MKGVFACLLIAAVAGACASAASPPVPSPTAPPSPASSVGAITKAVVDPRGDGFTLTGGQNGPFDLTAGTYRVAWWTEHCTNVRLWIAVGGNWSETSGPDTVLALPGGEKTVRDVPAGTGYLNKSRSCTEDDLIVRLEKV